MKKLLVLLLLMGPGTLAAAPAPLSRLQKMGAVLAAEDRRDAAALAPWLRDPDAGVRRRAALAAGRIGDPSHAAVLGERLNDSVPEVRRVAAVALGLIGAGSEADRLVAALKDGDAMVRARVAEALGRIGATRAAGAVAQMVLQAAPKGAAPVVVRGDDPGNPNDPWLEMRLGLFALAALQDVPAATTVLLEGGRPRFDWWAATWTAASLPAGELDAVLIAAAQSGDPLSRAIAATGLASRRAPAARETLLALARDREDEVAARALRALGTLGDASLVPVLMTVVREGKPTRVWAALDALAMTPGARASEEIVAFVGHDDPALRAGALKLLARTDREGLALILSGMDRDPVWSVRAAVAEGLVGAEDEAAQGLLFGMLKDPDPRIIAAALQAMGSAQGSQAELLLVQHLGHADMGVRAAAARGLAARAQGSGGALAADTTRALADAYRNAQHDVDPEARIVIVQALGAARDETSKTALRAAAADDAELAVRALAAKTLAAAGESAPNVRPVEPARPRLDYMLAMSPYDPPADRPLYTPRAFLHTRRGVIEIHLNTVESPLAVQTFMTLARRGFFNELEIHGVRPGVRIDAGCPRGDGLGGPGARLRREAAMRPFGRGAVGLDALAKDSEGSRFFITLAPDPQRDGAATHLGTVALGMDVADKLRPGDVILWVEIWDGR